MSGQALAVPRSRRRLRRRRSRAASARGHRPREERGEQDGGQRQTEHRHGHGADPIATPAIIDNPGRCDSAMPPAAPMNMRGEDRAAAEAAQRHAVGEALAYDEQHECPDRPGRGVLDERTAARPGRRTAPPRASVDRLGEDDRQPADRQAASGVSSSIAALDDGPEQQGQPRIAAPSDGGGDADADRPEELGDRRAAERRDVGDRQRERPEAGPGCPARRR